MIVIGLTGGSGSGKSSVGQLMKERGIAHIDCDQISRDIEKPNSACISELVDYFGKNILNPDGSLDRKNLASMAFANEGSTAALNSITHKYIIGQVEELIEEYAAKNRPAVVVDGAALIESGFIDRCNCIVVVVAPKRNRIKSIIHRDKISRKDAVLRMNAQKKNSFYRSFADYVIKNNGSLLQLKKKTFQVTDAILSGKEMRCNDHLSIR